MGSIVQRKWEIRSAACDDAGTVMLHDVDTAQVIWEININRYNRCSPLFIDNREVIIMHGQRNLAVVDVSKGLILRYIPNPALSEIRAMALFGLNVSNGPSLCLS